MSFLFNKFEEFVDPTWCPKLAAELKAEKAGKPVLIVSDGLGVNSMAMKIRMRDMGIVPDAIVFADTGGEKIDTYLHFVEANRWCRESGFPEITVVRHVPAIAPYRSLYGKCWKNSTVPSLAYKKGECSMTWKHNAIDGFVNSFGPALEAWEAGDSVARAIGYDASPADKRRKATADKRGYNAVEYAIGFDAGPADLRRKKRADGINAEGKGNSNCKGPIGFWYPLVEAEWDRDKCEEVIEAEGITVPVKSACFFCPAMTKPEIADLADRDPVHYAMAMALDARYVASKHYREDGFVKGLGMGGWSWNDHANEVGLPVIESPAATHADETGLPLCGDCNGCGGGCSSDLVSPGFGSLWEVV